MIGDSRGPQGFLANPNNPAYDTLNRLDHPFTLEGTKDGFYEMASSGTTSYFITPEAQDVYFFSRILIYAEDANFSDASQYGGAALPTGIALTLEDGSGVLYNFTPIRIKAAFEWAIYAGVDVKASGDAQADPFLARWTFTNAAGQVIVDGRRGQFLRLHVPDNLGSGGAGLAHHWILAQGYKTTP